MNQSESTEVAETEASKEETVEESTEETESAQEEAKAEKPKETPEEKASRLLRQTNQARKKLGLSPLEEAKETKEIVESKVKSELDETQLEILELKGYSETEDIDFIQKMMSKTGQTWRQVLKDEYVVSKLDSFKKARDVKAALPSSSKRSSSTASDNEDFYYQKYEQTGVLPKNMPSGMAIKLVNRKAAQSDVHKNPFD